MKKIFGGGIFPIFSVAHVCRAIGTDCFCCSLPPPIDPMSLEMDDEGLMPGSEELPEPPMRPDVLTHLLNWWNDGPDSWPSFVPPCRMFNDVLRIFKSRVQADMAEEWWTRQLRGRGVEGPFASSVESFEPTKKVSVYAAKHI